MFKLLAETSPSLVELATDFSEGKTYNYWGEFVNMIITLLIIIGLIFLSVVVLKKIMRSRMQHVNRSAAIKVLERRAINQKTSLYLVDIAGKTVVIGESPAGLNLITDLPDYEQPPEPEAPPAFSLPKKLKVLSRKNA